MHAAMTLGDLGPRPRDAVRVVIQDRTDLPEHLRPRLRVKEIDAGPILEITGQQIAKWRRWFRRMMRKVGRVLSFVALVALARQVGAQQGFTEMHMPLVIGAITSAICTSVKAEAWVGTHNFTVTTGDTVKCALFTSSATLGASTTAYSTTNEITGTGYTAGGTTIANVTPTTSGTTAILDWADASWTTASFTANGCVVYNSSKSNKSIFVIAFGSDQTVTSGTFTIQWPTADASNAILRF